MYLARAAAAAIFIGQFPHLPAASVAEFEANCLSLFYAFHIYSPSTIFPIQPSPFLLKTFAGLDR